MLELQFGIPKKNWHDPAMYAYNADSETDAVITSTVDLLFAGSEREALEEKIEQAKLTMRQGWASVPRLSLGAIKLPTPGQQDISKDKFVVEAAPFFVEYMAALNVMEQDEAERVVAQKLENYFVHETDFQKGRDIAGSVVQELKEQQHQKKKSAEDVA